MGFRAQSFGERLNMLGTKAVGFQGLGCRVGVRAFSRPLDGFRGSEATSTPSQAFSSINSHANWFDHDGKWLILETNGLGMGEYVE